MSREDHSVVISAQAFVEKHGREPLEAEIREMKPPTGDKIVKDGNNSRTRENGEFENYGILYMKVSADAPAPVFRDRPKQKGEFLSGPERKGYGTTGFKPKAAFGCKPTAHTRPNQKPGKKPSSGPARKGFGTTGFKPRRKGP